MRKLYRCLVMLTIMSFVIFLSACNKKASPDKNDGALSIEEPTTVPELTPDAPEQTPAAPETTPVTPEVTPDEPEITPVVGTGGSKVEESNEADTEISEELNKEIIKNPAADAELLLNDALGSFTTGYEASSESRKKNIEVAAAKIDQTIIMPGDIFSCNEILQPYTAENGYDIANSYEGGRIVSSYGGGVCQIASTLYNAVLQAELEIVERHSHSMTVSYVELSRDAAIAGDYMDFKFENNTNHPIIIQANAKLGKLTFELIGEEERDIQNRRIEYQTYVIQEVPPPDDVITYDETMPLGFTKVTQAAHIGYETELYKIIYVGGKEVDHMKVNQSYYQASPQYITLGTLAE